MRRRGEIRTVDREGKPFPLETFRRIIDINLIGTFAVISRFGARLIEIADMDDPPLRVALGPTATAEIVDRLTTDVASYRANETIWKTAALG